LFARAINSQGVTGTYRSALERNFKKSVGLKH
jgi:hypothetical protein